MKKYFSPGNLIVATGGLLAFVGMTAYFTDSVNLSVPTFFYGVPIFLIGLALKTTEIPPVELFDVENFKNNRFNRPKELTALAKDVTRWRYGTAHLESSLEALNLWSEENPPQLKEIEEITKEEKNGLRMRFELNYPIGGHPTAKLTAFDGESPISISARHRGQRLLSIM
mgnify:CR=1 FL=1